MTNIYADITGNIEESNVSQSKSFVSNKSPYQDNTTLDYSDQGHEQDYYQNETFIEKSMPQGIRKPLSCDNLLH